MGSVEKSRSFAAERDEHSPPLKEQKEESDLREEVRGGMGAEEGRGSKAFVGTKVVESKRTKKARKEEKAVAVESSKPVPVAPAPRKSCLKKAVPRPESVRLTRFLRKILFRPKPLTSEPVPTEEAAPVNVKINIDTSSNVTDDCVIPLAFRTPLVTQAANFRAPAGGDSIIANEITVDSPRRLSATINSDQMAVGELQPARTSLPI
ncbi:hypothetical protein M427DRAFT_33338 [Gonapodya prolifera JEL478]|uniref:Uncharacterized protein n=1 Tax=Gonapodya prolifera (strain JEL478) TaxID=1344416 RepID=A0A139AC16_GONPJ|nr:hypothetical protein M427DRAFT_33338 [Gonapodya prolifera JEL478]|eukprot:KXS14134.1 hypothetical protein M427DRAFT_33338 [Gonapodya prolifera JEL478]